MRSAALVTSSPSVLTRSTQNTDAQYPALHSAVLTPDRSNWVAAHTKDIFCVSSIMNRFETPIPSTTHCYIVTHS